MGGNGAQTVGILPQSMGYQALWGVEQAGWNGWGCPFNSSCELVPFLHKTCFFFPFALLLENSGELMYIDLG